MTCETCRASKRIKDTFGCNCDRLFNNIELLKREFFKIFKDDYQPKFQCRFADLVRRSKMTITEMIENLQAFKERWGDMEVFYS